MSALNQVFGGPAESVWRVFEQADRAVASLAEEASNAARAVTVVNVESVPSLAWFVGRTDGAAPELCCQKSGVVVRREPELFLQLPFSKNVGIVSTVVAVVRAMAFEIGLAPRLRASSHRRAAIWTCGGAPPLLPSR